MFTACNSNIFPRKNGPCISLKCKLFVQNISPEIIHLPLNFCINAIWEINIALSCSYWIGPLFLKKTSKGNLKLLYKIIIWDGSSCQSIDCYLFDWCFDWHAEPILWYLSTASPSMLWLSDISLRTHKVSSTSSSFCSFNSVVLQGTTAKSCWKYPFGMGPDAKDERLCLLKILLYCWCWFSSVADHSSIATTISLVSLQSALEQGPKWNKNELSDCDR